MSGDLSRRDWIVTGLAAAVPMTMGGYIHEQREHFSYDETSLSLPVGSMVTYTEADTEEPHLLWVDDTSQAGLKDSIDAPYFLARYEDSEIAAELPDRDPDEVIPVEEGAEISYYDNTLTVEDSEIDDAETDMIERYAGDEHISLGFEEEIQKLDDQIVGRKDF